MATAENSLTQNIRGMTAGTPSETPAGITSENKIVVAQSIGSKNNIKSQLNMTQASRTECTDQVVSEGNIINEPGSLRQEIQMDVKSGDNQY